VSQSATIIIDRPAKEVFNYVMDIPNDAHWRIHTGVVEAAYTSDPPLGVGTTGFDRISVNGRDMVVEWRTVEYEPGMLARWEFVSGPTQGSGGYVCEAIGDSTRFTLEANIKPTGPLRVLGPIFGMMVRRQISADVELLKTILES
jgi:uncharacterized membrane protein